MTNKERQIISNFIGDFISEEQFLNDFTVNINSNPNYIRQLLCCASEEENAEDVDSILFVIFTFNLITEDYVDLLCKLMNASWHHSHEDIATIFQSYMFPQAVTSLYQAALTRFKYLEYDSSYALAVKCIWALGDINTSESRKKLELLSESDNEIIKQNALRQLERKN